MKGSWRLRPCICNPRQAAVDGEVEGDATPEGVPPPGEQGSPHDKFGGEEADDDEQHVVGEAADEVQARRMRFWLEPPPLVGCLAIHLSRRRRWCTCVLGVYCVLGVRECVLVCMPPRSGEVCVSVSFTRKKFALNLLACGVLPRVVSTLFTSPC